jgi:hypothetical protein
MNEKIYMIISTEENLCNSTSPDKLGIKGMYLNPKKATYEKPRVIISEWREDKAFPL